MILLYYRIRSILTEYCQVGYVFGKTFFRTRTDLFIILSVFFEMGTISKYKYLFKLIFNVTSICLDDIDVILKNKTRDSTN